MMHVQSPDLMGFIVTKTPIDPCTAVDTFYSDIIVPQSWVSRDKLLYTQPSSFFCIL